MSKAKKEKLIQKDGDLSQSKVKEYLENQKNANNYVAKGKGTQYKKF